MIKFIKPVISCDVVVYYLLRVVKLGWRGGTFLSIDS